MPARTGSPRRLPGEPAVTADIVETWGDFVALPENRSALWAVRLLERAVRKPGCRPPFAPLVLHGPPGTGKSHLAATLVRQLADAPDVVTSQTVSAGDVARTASGDSDDRAGFEDPGLRSCDLLVLEDVQHLPAKSADTAGDLIDRRTARRKATIVTANAGPAALSHLPQRFVSRLVAGLVVPLEPLSAASRRVLLEAAARFRGVRLTPAALDWLAASATGGGVRPLLGTLGNLAAIAPAFPGPLDRPDVEAALAVSGQPTSAGPDAAAIVKRVAAAFGVSEKELLGPSRLRRVLVPRQVAMYLARELTPLSLPRIGATFAGRDHTTVLHACRKIEAELGEDERLAGLVRQLRAELG